MTNYRVELSSDLSFRSDFALKHSAEDTTVIKMSTKHTYSNYAEKFISYAEIDYEAAKVLFEVQDRSYDFMNQAAFLCAQSTEKYLKAYLISKSDQVFPGLTFEKIIKKLKTEFGHRLDLLLAKCIKTEPKLAALSKDIAELVPYSLLKYPDIEDEKVFSDEGLRISSSLSKNLENIGKLIKEQLS